MYSLLYVVNKDETCGFIQYVTCTENRHDLLDTNILQSKGELIPLHTHSMVRAISVCCFKLVFNMDVSFEFAIRLYTLSKAVHSVPVYIITLEMACCCVLPSNMLKN